MVWMIGAVGYGSDSWCEGVDDCQCVVVGELFVIGWLGGWVVEVED